MSSTAVVHSGSAVSTIVVRGDDALASNPPRRPKRPTKTNVNENHGSNTPQTPSCLQPPPNAGRLEQIRALKRKREEEMDALERFAVQDVVRLAEQEKKIKKLEEELAREQGSNRGMALQLKGLQGALGNLEQQTSALEQQTSALEEEKNKQQREAETLQEINTTFLNEIEDLRAQVSKLTEAKSGVEAALEGYQRDTYRLIESSNKKQDQLLKSQARIKQLEEKNRTAHDANEALTAELKVKGAAVSSMEGTIRERESANLALRDQLQQKSLILEQIKSLV